MNTLSIDRTQSRLETEQLWQTYLRSPSDELRNALVVRYRPLVRAIARRLHNRLPRRVDIEDLCQIGSVGLMRAIASYDPSRNVRFETFCRQRILGAMLDDLRDQDWVPRQVRKEIRAYQDAVSGARLALGRDPTGQEVADSLRATQGDCQELARAAQALGELSAAAVGPARVRACRPTHFEDVVDPRTPAPADQLQNADLQDVLGRALPPTQRQILALYYYDGLTMKEIGATLALSECRISQLHRALLRRLRCHLAARRPLRVCA